MTPLIVSEVIFAGAALAALILLMFARHERRRSGTAAYDWLAAALVTFLFVSVPIEQLGYDFDAPDNPYWVRIVGIGLALFPGLLARSIFAMCGNRSSWALRISDVFSLAVVTLALTMPTLPGANYPSPPLLYVLLIVGIAVEMVFASAISVRELTRASHGQPGVIRMRALLLSAAQIVFTLTFLSWIAAPGDTASLIANSVLIVVGAILISALVWPRHLLQLIDRHPRDRWQSIGMLMSSTEVRDDLSTIVDDVARTWGLAGIAIVDHENTTLELRGHSRRESNSARRMQEQRFGGGGISIIVWTTPLSLPIDRTDRVYLDLLATMIHFALDRESTTSIQADAVADAAAASDSLAAANARLIEADELKDRFVSLVSHELRTPLTSIVGIAHTARARWHDLSQEQLHEFLDIIIQQGDRLARIIESLLMTSQIEAHALGLTRVRVDLEEALQEAILDAGIAPSVIEIDIASDAQTFVSDPQAVYEILVNLLSNAQKYGKAPIRVSIVRRGDHLEFTVCDEGDGVHASVRDRLFERFARGFDLDQPGTGLGLSIVRDLATALEGEAGYRPRDPGSTFWVRLPATS